MNSDLTWAWTTLGVTEGAPPHVVRSAWRAGVRRSHPDANGGGDVEAFHRINDAYKALQSVLGEAPAGAQPVTAPQQHSTPGPVPEVEPIDITDFYLDEPETSSTETKKPRTRGSDTPGAATRSAVDAARSETGGHGRHVAPILTLGVLGVGSRHLAQKLAPGLITQLPSLIVATAGLVLAGSLIAIDQARTRNARSEDDLGESKLPVSPVAAFVVLVAAVAELFVTVIAVPVLIAAVAIAIIRRRRVAVP